MTRTFIALELDEALQRHLDGVIRQVARQLPALRWVDPAGIHLTLAFLGELSDEQVAEAMNATEVAARNVPPFEYHLTTPGIFGSPRQPRVVWIGIDEPSGKLRQLHHALNAELEQRGFAVDTRPFSPHLTLSRVKAPLKPEEQAILQQFLNSKHGNSSSPEYHVKQVSVMKSELSRTGARYTCLREYALKRAE
jgi:2'-5' RNA ligase